MLPFQTVLCALDFEPGSERALGQAADLAERAHAALHLVYVAPPFRTRQALADDAGDAFRQRVGAFVNRALGADDAFDVLAPEVHQVRGGVPAEGILRRAEAVGANLVVVGTHGRRGLAHAVLGSVAAEVLRRSPVPVLVVPGRAARTAPETERPVLVALDFSEHSPVALRTAQALAADGAAPVAAVHVREATPDNLVDPDTLFRIPGGPATGLASREAAHEAMDRLLKGATPVVPVERYVIPGAPEVEIVGLASRIGAGTIVMGTHGRSGWDRIRLGSVAEWVVRHAPCPVLVVSAAAAGEDAGGEGPMPSRAARDS